MGSSTMGWKEKPDAAIAESKISLEIGRRMPRFKKLGSSDISVCEVCLGTMTFGTMTANEADAHAILDRYVELGGNFIDTAEMYPVPTDPAWMGASEEVIGRWLAKGGAELRAKVVIATKVSGPRAAARYAPQIREKTLTGSTEAAPAEPDFSRAQIRRACEASLKRLQTDYIDLYQLHWPERYVPKWGGAQYLAAGAAQDAHHHLTGFEAIVATMGELLSEGKIKTWGVSNETSYGTCMFVEASRRQGVAPPVSIQNDFSLCYRTYEVSSLNVRERAGRGQGEGRARAGRRQGEDRARAGRRPGSAPQRII
tara:strand:+ start:1042 stop:1977 length:936 start_codon:yes stop_codon:yes gene_type:complete